jgi:hypothetical protein
MRFTLTVVHGMKLLKHEKAYRPQTSTMDVMLTIAKMSLGELS